MLTPLLLPLSLPLPHFFSRSLSPVSHLLSPSPDTPHISIEEPCQMLLNFVLRNTLTLEMAISEHYQMLSVHVLVTPIENFAAAGQTATIVIDINDTAPSSTRTYRANPGSNWNFVNLANNRGEKRKCIRPD